MGAGRSVQRVAAVEAEDSGGARERKAEKVKEKKSRSRARQTYVDVEVKDPVLLETGLTQNQDDHVALPQHLVLGQVSFLLLSSSSPPRSLATSGSDKGRAGHGGARPLHQDDETSAHVAHQQ